MTLKYENTAEVGDIIVAQDFQPMPDRGDSFVLGKVIGKDTVGGIKCYIIICALDVFGGKMQPYKDSRFGQQMYIPFETGMDWEGRITKV